MLRTYPLPNAHRLRLDAKPLDDLTVVAIEQMSPDEDWVEIDQEVVPTILLKDVLTEWYDISPTGLAILGVN